MDPNIFKSNFTVDSFHFSWPVVFTTAFESSGPGII